VVFGDTAVFPDQTTTLTKPIQSAPPTIDANRLFLPTSERKAFSISPAANAGPFLSTEFPASATSRIMNSLGLGWVHAIWVPQFVQWLKKANYPPTNGEEDSLKNATIESLKNVGGDGVFYFSSHGIILGSADDPANPLHFALWTSTKVDPPFPPNAPAQGLDIYRALKGADPFTHQEVHEDHWAITSKFVRKYWKNFSANSLVYIDACSSGSPGAADFEKAIFEKKASLYVGWNCANGVEIEEETSAKTAHYIFDRLLGADVAEQVLPPPKPPQRPFDFATVYSNLSQHDLGESPGCVLDFRRKSGQFGLLCPSIREVFADQTSGQFSPGQLDIVGLFGTDPGEGFRTVTVGGEKVTVKSWKLRSPNYPGDPDERRAPQGTCAPHGLHNRAQPAHR
jgi:hypothetical protein